MGKGLRVGGGGGGGGMPPLERYVNYRRWGFG